MGGRDLDRFSKYAFGIFANSLRGFSGSGVGSPTGRSGISPTTSNLADIIRFEASFDQAARAGPAARRGLSGTTPGWDRRPVRRAVGTLIQLNVGYALASTVPEFQGQKEYRLEVLKLFGQR